MNNAVLLLMSDLDDGLVNPGALPVRGCILNHVALLMAS